MSKEGIRKIIQLFKADSGDDVALADDGTTWWWRQYHAGQPGGWEPWADMLPRIDGPAPEAAFTPDPDDRDYARCMAAYSPKLSRCVGGRLVVSGHVCPHCQSDSPSENCKSPRKE